MSALIERPLYPSSDMSDLLKVKARNDVGDSPRPTLLTQGLNEEGPSVMEQNDDRGSVRDPEGSGSLDTFKTNDQLRSSDQSLGRDWSAWDDAGRRRHLLEADNTSGNDGSDISQPMQPTLLGSYGAQRAREAAFEPPSPARDEEAMRRKRMDDIAEHNSLAMLDLADPVDAAFHEDGYGGLVARGDKSKSIASRNIIATAAGTREHMSDQQYPLAKSSTSSLTQTPHRDATSAPTTSKINSVTLERSFAGPVDARSSFLSPDSLAYQGRTPGLPPSQVPDEKEDFKGRAYRHLHPDLKPIHPPTTKAVTPSEMYNELDFDLQGPTFAQVEWSYSEYAQRAKILGYYALRQAEYGFPGADHVDDDSDAYRHALWSFLMARELGPQVAKAFTDAWEISHPGGPADFSPIGSRLMDLYNNRVGRMLALDPRNRERPAEEVIHEALKNGLLQTRRFSLMPPATHIP